MGKGVGAATLTGITPEPFWLILLPQVWKQGILILWSLPPGSAVRHGSYSWCAGTGQGPAEAWWPATRQLLSPFRVFPKLQCNKIFSPFVLNCWPQVRHILSGRWCPEGIVFFERRFPMATRYVRTEAQFSCKMMDRCDDLKFPGTQWEIKY